MSEFQNTIDLLGDGIVAATVVDRSIGIYDDDVLKSLGNAAFAYCTNLTSVNLPSVTKVGSGAFRNCSALTSVNMLSVTKIDSSTFSGCSALISVNLPSTPPTLANVTAFSSVPTTCVFYIPTGSLAAYQSATNWSSLTSTYTFTEEDR